MNTPENIPSIPPAGEGRGAVPVQDMQAIFEANLRLNHNRPFKSESSPASRIFQKLVNRGMDSAKAAEFVRALKLTGWQGLTRYIDPGLI